jgi:peroxiredoxin
MAIGVSSRGRVGERLPDISLPTLDGDRLDFASLRGKKALLFFWGSW